MNGSSRQRVEAGRRGIAAAVRAPALVLFCAALAGACDSGPTYGYAPPDEVAAVVGPSYASSTGTVAVSPSGATVAAGATVQLTAVDGSGKPVNATWSSSNPAVATVSGTGLVTGVAAGQAVVTARTRRQSAGAAVTVTAPSPPATDACTAIPHLRTVAAASVAELTAAVANARAGDLIVLADGTYATRLALTASGTADAPITLCGTRRAVLDGLGISGGNAVRIDGSYWRLQGFGITNGLRGVLVQGGRYNVLSDLEIHGIGQEAVHLRAFSSSNVVQRNRIYETGLVEPRYGEGVYIGTASTDWAAITGGGPDASDYNQVLDNVFGPNIRAENVDVKDGTRGGVIRGNRFSGVGTQEDDWVDLAGNGYRLEGNSGTSLAAGHGFRIRAAVAGWGSDNVLTGNTVDLQGPGYGFMISSTTAGNAVRCDNSVANAGSGFSNVSCTP